MRSGVGGSIRVRNANLQVSSFNNCRGNVRSDVIGMAGLVGWPLDVVARPERLVSTANDDQGQSTLWTLLVAVRLLSVYLFNLVLYAMPLTLAGYGVDSAGAPPAVVANALDPVVADPDAVWAFAFALGQNSVFLLVATLLTFATFHVGIALTGNSRGFLRSLRAVTYSTGIYLAIMFTVVWYVSTAPGVKVVDDFLLWLQAEFILYFVDLLGADLTLAGGRPSPVEATRITTVGQFALVVLLLAAIYYLYVLYVGAREGHGVTRIEALMATGFVTVSPALFVVGLVQLTFWT